MYAKQERVGDSLTEPHAILTPLGWLACGRRSGRSDSSAKIFRTNLKEDVSDKSSLKQTTVDKDKHIAELESVIKDLAMKDELPQPSRSDLAAKKLAEPHVKLNSNRFEIPVPLKMTSFLSNNYVLARDRISTLRKKALKQFDLDEFLSESMSEWQENGYIERAPDETDCCKSVCYLPYFVTSQAKKRIVYDGKSEYKGVCVNDVIMAGPDLLNPLLHVLMRFLLGKFALMADVTKCFFQIKLPEAHRDLFRLLW